MKKKYSFLSALVLVIIISGCSGSPKGTEVPVPGQAPDLTVSESDSYHVRLSWTGVEGAKYYAIHRSESASGPFTKVDDYEITSTEWSDFSMSSYTTYWYKLSAENDGGEGPQSLNAISAALHTPVPQGGWASNVTGTSITVNWAPVIGAAGYKVYRYTSIGGSISEIADCTGTSFIDTSVTSGTAYSYNVSAVSGGFGESNQNSMVISQKAETGSAPTVTPNFNTTNITTTSTSITVDWWNGPFTACGFNIYRSSSSGGTFTKMNITPVYTSSYTDTGLLLGTSYYYKIAAENVFGEGPLSAEKSYSTLSN